MITQEEKIRRGQAINLAINDAVHNSRECDIKYVYKKFIVYQTLIEMLQGSDQSLIQEVVESKDFDTAMTMLKKAMEK
ncbi:MAG TPA: hypothetical protein VER35_01665 [Candidatus Limnocylindrales bacterium]|nr:hypothetical protein [Candidatus Limnocylindrales bacterium]